MEKVKSTTGQVHIIDPHRKAARDDRPLTLCMSKVTEKWTATGDGSPIPIAAGLPASFLRSATNKKTGHPGRHPRMARNNLNPEV
jgi:hypothetical protein